MLMIIIVVIAIHTAGFLLVSANSCQIPSPENLWTKPGEHSMHTHTRKKNFAYRLRIFIYLSCMYAFNEVCVCEFVYRLYCKKRWHLWTYLKIKVNMLKKTYLSKNQVGTNSHSRNIYIIYLFSEVNVFFLSPIQSLTLTISPSLMDLLSLDL